MDFIDNRRIFTDIAIPYKLNAEMDIDITAYNEFRPYIKKPGSDNTRHEAVTIHSSDRFWVIIIL
jgi:hypothetical protein